MSLKTFFNKYIFKFCVFLEGLYISLIQFFLIKTLSLVYFFFFSQRSCLVLESSDLNPRLPSCSYKPAVWGDCYRLPLIPSSKYCLNCIQFFFTQDLCYVKNQVQQNWFCFNLKLVICSKTSHFMNNIENFCIKN